MRPCDRRSVNPTGPLLVQNADAGDVDRAAALLIAALRETEDESVEHYAQRRRIEEFRHSALPTVVFAEKLAANGDTVATKLLTEIVEATTGADAALDRDVAGSSRLLDEAVETMKRLVDHCLIRQRQLDRQQAARLEREEAERLRRLVRERQAVIAQHESRYAQVLDTSPASLDSALLVRARSAARQSRPRRQAGDGSRVGERGPPRPRARPASDEDGPDDDLAAADGAPA